MQIHGDAIRFGIHSGPHHTGYEGLRDLWVRADGLGYDWLSVFDHFLPIQGDWTGPCLEGTALLSALAAQTKRARVSLLVTGVTYRHPAIAANVAATIDHVSGGRLEYGVGAAWYEREHEQYGVGFPRVGVRMDMLDEACRIMRGMWQQETTTFHGEHYRVTDARCEPKPVQERLPLVIGGGGERRTLRIVAEHADVWNAFLTTPEALAHKLDVLRGHCEDVGRPFEDIRKSVALRAVLDRDKAEAQRRAAPTLAATTNPDLLAGFYVGAPDGLAERLRGLAELGIGDFLLSATAPFDPETIELLIGEVAPAVRGS
ncbi:MAG TPA: LLM class F420-dependent oxidoreductase [Solirubrobacteraceae bacterium]|nr:LLM class F420-dependent oxidoreductase [Solirubrobacteraceae bacterium]